MEYEPDPLEGGDPSEEVIRHSYASHISIPMLNHETEIVNIGRRSQNECVIITVIGEKKPEGSIGFWCWQVCLIL